MSAEDSLQLKQFLYEMLRRTHRPHRLCKKIDGSLWEYISFPWIETEGPNVGKILVNIRWPGDPTTMETVEAMKAHPEHRDCLCAEARELLGSDEFYLAPRKAGQ